MKIVMPIACLSAALMMSPIFAAKPQPVMHTSQQAVVDMNHAGSTALQSLHGIGAKKAAAIIAYRKAHGSFKSVDDLTKVHGISHGLLKRVQLNNPGRLKLAS